MISETDAIDRITDDVLPGFLAWREGGLRAALVTLLSVEGGGYRPAGAQIAVCETGARIGYISEGCLENAIAEEARKALACGRNRILRYGAASDAPDIKLPCGASMSLYVDVDFDIDLARRIIAAGEERQPVALVYDLDAGAARLTPAEANVVAAHAPGRFLRPYHPKLRILAIGAAAGIVSLAHMARAAGFRIDTASPDDAVLDATRAAATLQYRLATPSSLPEFSVDGRTAIVLLFHDHDWEVALLKAACRSDAFYIGAMGSRRTHEARREALAACGLPEAELRRIRGPAGLFPGGRNAPEIALSILAEIAMEARGAFSPRVEGGMADRALHDQERAP